MLGSFLLLRGLCVLLFLSTLSLAQATTVTYTSSASWTAPVGVTSVDVEVWGGGGAGGGQDQNSDGGGGGGGGAYSKKISIPVTPGSNYTISVGVGGAGVQSSTGGAGGDSYFINVSTVLAKGGAGGMPSSGTPPSGGPGGAATSGVGDNKYSGGTGGRGSNNKNGRGGPGGSSAGTAADGTSGPDPYSTLLAAAPPLGGGIGGNGGDTGHDGSAPVSGNGGGGGGSGEGTNRANRTGGDGAGGKVMLTYTVVFACTQPANTPAGLTLTCQCDTFGRTSLKPSTIFGGDWLLNYSNTSGGTFGNPKIVNQGYLRLTDATTNNSDSATVPGIFPAAGNYISVEFKHYAYNGSGADGVGVVLSDYSQPPVPGAFGGSLGYAQKVGINGFNYGWLGVGLDEYGNYSTAGGEGHIDGPGAYPESIGIRGSGSGTTGYPWIGGSLCGATGTWPNATYPYTYNRTTATCANGNAGSIDDRTSTVPSPGYGYQIVVDASAYTSGNHTAKVSVGRDTSGGASYTSLIPPIDIYVAKPTQAVVPANWQITFTGSTGSAANIHEIGALKICASSMLAPSSTGTAGGFNAIDSALANSKVSALYGHIFTKVAGVPFKLNVAALATPTTNGVNNVYNSSVNKSSVTVSLIDDSVGAACNATPSTCSACAKPVLATSQPMSFATADAGFKASSNFTVSGAYPRVIAKMSDGTTTGCSIDAFSVRPAYDVPLSVTSPTKAGVFAISVGSKDPSGNTLTGGIGAPTLATTAVVNLSLQSWTAGATAGTFFYNDVGTFNLPANALYDSQFGTASGDQASGDCNPGSGAPYVPNTCYGYSGSTCTNATPWSPDSSGKYGCDIGSAALNNVGRFYPDHYEASSPQLFPACTPGGFTYMGQGFNLTDATGSNPVQIKALASGKTFADSALPSYTGTYTPRAMVRFRAQDGLTPATDLIGRIASLAASNTWTSGVYTAPASPFIFARPTSTPPDATWGPFDALDIGMAVDDADGSGYLAATSTIAWTTPASCTNTGSSECRKYVSLTGGSTTKMRFGRLHMLNAYGSELLPLRVPVRAEYYVGGNAWAVSSSDTCTVIEANSLQLGSVFKPARSSLAFSTPAAGVTVSPMQGGIGYLIIQPSVKGAGSTDLVLNLGGSVATTSCAALISPVGGIAPLASIDYLAGNWCGASYDRAPIARIKFGSPKAPYIYLRERY